MLDNVKSYPLYFVLKASPAEGDAFDYAYIYKFYTERTSLYQRIKYVMRVEAYEDVFAIKFYAARDRKLDDKYNRILRAHSYRGTLQTLLTCAEVVLHLYARHPSASFVVQGASSKDFESGKEEDGYRTQRYRIYIVAWPFLFSLIKTFIILTKKMQVYICSSTAIIAPM